MLFVVKVVVAQSQCQDCYKSNPKRYNSSAERYKSASNAAYTSKTAPLDRYTATTRFPLKIQTGFDKRTPFKTSIANHASEKGQAPIRRERQRSGKSPPRAGAGTRTTAPSPIKSNEVNRHKHIYRTARARGQRCQSHICGRRRSCRYVGFARHAKVTRPRYTTRLTRCTTTAERGRR